jgi:acetoin utilization protein AcuB
MNVDEIMTDGVTTIDEDATVGAALEIMDEQRIRHLPVVRGREVVGMVTDRDLRGLGLSLVNDLESFDALKGRLAQPVSSVMSADVITTETGTDVSEILDLFVEEKIGAVPVVEGDTRDLVGIVSTVDVIRALRDNLE